MLLALVLPLLQSAAKPEAVALPHDWKTGTRYHVELTKSREDYQGETLSKMSSTRTPIDVEVLERRESGYTLRWTFGRPDPAPDEDMTQALANQIAALVEGLKMDLETDALGSVTKLVDPSAMEAHFEAGTQKLFAKLQAAHASEQDLEAVRAAATGLKGAGFRGGYLQLASRFYLPSGATLVPGQKQTYEDRLPNPFGGDPLPARASLELHDVRRDLGEAVVDWRLSLDPAKAGPVLEASIRAFARKTGQELPSEASLTFDAIEDAATYVYDLATGIPRSVVTTRTTVMAGTRRVDTQRYVVTMPQTK
jgi:hypothetical protein